jgi:hypothetical protein
MYWKASDAPPAPLLEVLEGDDENAQLELVVREDVVADTNKDMIWKQVLAHFEFPDLYEDRLATVRYWAMQKSAIAFPSYKKRLTKDYIKKGITPDFKQKGLGKLRDTGMHLCGTRNRQTPSR